VGFFNFQEKVFRFLVFMLAKLPVGRQAPEVYRPAPIRMAPAGCLIDGQRLQDATPTAGAVLCEAPPLVGLRSRPFYLTVKKANPRYRRRDWL
jgi:hypothetical protein